jgi:hypothetical protein
MLAVPPDRPTHFSTLAEALDCGANVAAQRQHMATLWTQSAQIARPAQDPRPNDSDNLTVMLFCKRKILPIFIYLLPAAAFGASPRKNAT